MKWSWKLIRIAGIDVYVHATFFFLIIWIGLSYWRIRENPVDVINGVGFILLLFGCVVLHELGHALMARRYGIETRKITLLPIGGIASLERMPRQPKHEIAVALAGPLVNLLIAFVIWFGISLSSGFSQVAQFSLIEGSFMERLMLVNIVLAVFNLLPAFPMDGGRVLRAVLSMRMDHNSATQQAAKIGQSIAIGLGLLGIMYNPFLIFIALFVWIGATAEANLEQLKTTLSDVSVGNAMLTDFDTLSDDDSLSVAIKYTLAGSQKDFPVTAAGNTVGVLSQDDLMKGLLKGGEGARVSEYMQQEINSADINEPLQSIMERLQGTKCPLLTVTDNNNIAGIINLDNIIELVRIHSALQKPPGDK